MYVLQMFKSLCCFIHYHSSTSHSSVPKTPNKDKKLCCPAMPGFFGLDSREGGETVWRAMALIPCKHKDSTSTQATFDRFHCTHHHHHHLLLLHLLLLLLLLLSRRLIPQYSTIISTGYHPTFRCDHPTKPSSSTATNFDEAIHKLLDGVVHWKFVT